MKAKIILCCLIAFLVIANMVEPTAKASYNINGGQWNATVGGTCVAAADVCTFYE